MDIYKEFNKIIKKNILEKKNRFVICMFGKNGLLLKNLLNNQYGINEEFIIDNELYLYNDKIISLGKVKELIGKEKLQFIITSDAEEFVKELKKYINTEQIYNPFADKQENLAIGKYSYGPLVDMMKNGHPEIGKIGSFCSFAPGTCVVWNHPTNLVTSHEFMYDNHNCKRLKCKGILKWREINKKCVIENDIWLGQNVIITNGAHIGNGVIAGAGSIITKDIPDYAIVAGNPARIIRYRFTTQQIQQLMAIKWWEWPDEKIRECQSDFLDINVFLNKHYKNVYIRSV